MIVEIRPNLLVRTDGKVKNTSGHHNSKTDWHNGYPNSTGYYEVRTPKTREMLKVHRLVAEAFIENTDNSPQVDHIDGNRRNNQVENLKWVTVRQNTSNKPIHRNGKLVGASFRKETNNWQARARINGKTKHLGMFDSEDLAHKAYIRAIEEL